MCLAYMYPGSMSNTFQQEVLTMLGQGDDSYSHSLRMGYDNFQWFESSVMQSCNSYSILFIALTTLCCPPGISTTLLPLATTVPV